MPEPSLVTFPLRVSPQLQDRLNRLAGEARMKPTAYVRHLLEQITSERPPAPAPVVTTPPPAALPDEVLRRLAHATLFIEMAVEASLQDADEIAPVLRETAEQRVSDLLGTKPRTQERAPARVEAAEQVGEA